MIESRHILAVSYGTFRCSLAGFDEPFEILQSIAIYFGDLMEDDPQFGTEDHEPNLDIIKKIAERHIEADIELTIQDGNVHLCPVGYAASRKNTDHDDDAPAAVLVLGDGDAVTSPDLQENTDIDGTEAEPQDPAVTDTVAPFVLTSRVDSADADETPHSPSEQGVDTDLGDGQPLHMARVIKMRRDHFDAAVASGTIEAVDEQTDPETGEDGEAAGKDDIAASSADNHPDTAGYQSGQQDDDLAEDIRNLISSTDLETTDEDNLVAELAEIERDAKALEEQQKANRVVPRTLDELVAEDLGEISMTDSANADAAQRQDDQTEREVALDRLLDKTNDQLGDQEGNRRRAAIAHLKAAVAATKADELLQSKRRQGEAETIDKFRDDLAQVVGRAAPDPDSADDEKPLLLASELRVENGDTWTRDISDHSPGIQQPSESFADFVERTGVKELPDLLEAAAAYSKFIEGEETVSRPQMIRRATSISPENAISREQTLKSFGQLLSSGRLQKLGQGQFMIADGNRFEKAARSPNGPS